MRSRGIIFPTALAQKNRVGGAASGSGTGSFALAGRGVGAGAFVARRGVRGSLFSCVPANYRFREILRATQQIDHLLNHEGSSRRSSKVISRKASLRLPDAFAKKTVITNLGPGTATIYEESSVVRVLQAMASVELPLGGRQNIYASSRSESEIDTLTISHCDRFTPSPVKPDNWIDPIYADYLVVRYTWGEESGLDLDTQTHFEATDPSIDNKFVGWGGSAAIYAGGAPVLQWVGDNTGQGGMESALVSVQNLFDALPETAGVAIRIRGNWYGQRQNGNVEVRVQAYKGGSMSMGEGSKNWVNSGGELIFSQSFQVNVTLQERRPVEENTPPWAQNLGLIALGPQGNPVTITQAN